MPKTTCKGSNNLWYMQIVVIQTIFLSPFFLKTTTCARINILGRSWKYNSLPRQEVLISPKGLERLLDCRGMLLVYVVVVVVKNPLAFTLYTLHLTPYPLPLHLTPYTLHPHSSLIVHNLLIAYKQYSGTIICSACFMQVTLHGPLMSMTIPSASKD